MAHTNRFDKKMAEIVYGVHEGDRIVITELKDPYIPRGSYNGVEGIVEHIDDMGQLHGTWGGLAIIPGEDKFIVTEHNEVAGKMYLYSFRIVDVIHIYAGNRERAREIFAENFPDRAIMQMQLVREATREEYSEIAATGAPKPKRLKMWVNESAKKEED